MKANSSLGVLKVFADAGCGFDIVSGGELARVQVCGKTWSYPALADGKLYVRDGRELQCLDLKAQPTAAR